MKSKENSRGVFVDSTGLNSAKRSKFSMICYVLFGSIFIGGNYMIPTELIVKQFPGSALLGAIYFFHELDAFYIQQWKLSISEK